MSIAFENVETFVLLDWYVDDFNSKSLRYQMTDNYGFTLQAFKASTQGMEILARMKNPILNIAKKLDLSINQETLSTEVNGNLVRSNYLSFGVDAEELRETYALQFIGEILKTKMDMEIPPLRFKLFHLPPLPIATTDEGHIMHSQVGFTNIRKKRIEVNVYPPRDYESIFNTLVHEVCHLCFLEESEIEKAGEVELKVKAHVKSFHDKCRDEWKSKRNSILENLNNTIETKLSVLRGADSALKKFQKDLVKAKSVIGTFKKFYDAIADENVKVTKL